MRERSKEYGKRSRDVNRFGDGCHVKLFRQIWGIVVVVLWIALMLLIYWFSDQPDVISSEQSMQIGKLICSIFVNGYDALSEVTKNQYAELIDHFVRKSAHFCEYAVLGMLTWGSFWVMFTDCLKNRKRYSEKDKTEDEKGLFWKGNPEDGKAYRRIYRLDYFAWLWCICYAATDEFHQLFVPGRYGMVRDVILDSMGALTGIVVCIWVRERFLKYDTKSGTDRANGDESN